MPKVRWLVSHGFCSNFHTLSSSAKSVKIGWDLTKLQKVLRWELFLTHSVVVHYDLLTEALIDGFSSEKKHIFGYCFADCSCICKLCCCFSVTLAGRSPDTSAQAPPPTRQHPCYGDCLEVKREYCQNCSVLDCVTQCSQSAAHLCEQFLQVQ